MTWSLMVKDDKGLNRKISHVFTCNRRHTKTIIHQFTCFVKFPSYVVRFLHHHRNLPPVVSIAPFHELVHLPLLVHLSTEISLAQLTTSKFRLRTVCILESLLINRIRSLVNKTSHLCY